MSEDGVEAYVYGEFSSRLAKLEEKRNLVLNLAKWAEAAQINGLETLSVFLRSVLEFESRSLLEEEKEMVRARKLLAEAEKLDKIIKYKEAREETEVEPIERRF